MDHINNRSFLVTSSVETTALQHALNSSRHVCMPLLVIDRRLKQLKSRGQCWILCLVLQLVSDGMVLKELLYIKPSCNNLLYLNNRIMYLRSQMMFYTPYCWIFEVADNNSKWKKNAVYPSANVSKSMFRDSYLCELLFCLLEETVWHESQNIYVVSEVPLSLKAHLQTLSLQEHCGCACLELWPW